jgi:hypothetical protein
VRGYHKRSKNPEGNESQRVVVFHGKTRGNWSSIAELIVQDLSRFA